MKNKIYLILIALILAFAIYYCRLPDINSCDISELIEIKGIGYARAKIIVENRPYKNYLQLEKLNKIGKSTIKNLKRNTKILIK